MSEKQKGTGLLELVPHNYLKYDLFYSFLSIVTQFVTALPPTLSVTATVGRFFGAAPMGSPMSCL